MVKYILSFLVALLLTLAVEYLLIKVLKRKRIGQNILSYVDNHSSKAGTPTMGGIGFTICSALTVLIFTGVKNRFSLIAVAVMVSYGIIGFMDDYLKLKHKENLGLKAYQKIIAQSGIAIIMSVYCYYDPYIGGEIIIPFTDIVININWWVIPLIFIMYIAVTNATNLLDGLDGLAGSNSAVIFLTLGVMCAVFAYNYGYDGNTLLAEEMKSLTIFSFAVFGSLLGFLCYNGFPAKIFMGDTGSLALGGAIATICIFARNPFIILLLGIILVITCISVIIQVVYFKLTHGKRIFLMSPLHHHFQYKGIHESKIVVVYAVITIIAGMISLISFF